MWHAAAIRTTELCALRQSRAWTRRISSQSRARTRSTGRNSVDGVLGVERGGGNYPGDCRTDNLRWNNDANEWWAATGGFGLAASSSNFHWRNDPDQSRRRFHRRMGTTSARAVGTRCDPSCRLHFAVRYPAWHGPGNLYALGITAHTIRRRIPGAGEGGVIGFAETRFPRRVHRGTRRGAR